MIIMYVFVGAFSVMLSFVCFFGGIYMRWKAHLTVYESAFALLFWVLPVLIAVSCFRENERIKREARRKLDKIMDQEMGGRISQRVESKRMAG